MFTREEKRGPRRSNRGRIESSKTRGGKIEKSYLDASRRSSFEGGAFIAERVGFNARGGEGRWLG